MVAKYLFVDLGRKPPFYLKNSIKHARAANPTSEIYYVTDNFFNSKFLDKMKVITIRINREKFKDIVGLLQEYYLEKSGHRDGYWLNSCLRLFAIEEFIKITKFDKFIHLESDAIILFGEKDFDEIMLNYDSNYTCFDNANSSVPTILIITDSNLYLSFMKYLSNCLSDKEMYPEFYWNDIYSFNLGYKEGYFKALKTIPSNNNKPNNNLETQVFDTAIYGKYLLGQDPRNVKFRLKSGTIDTIDAKIFPYSAKWKMIKNNTVPHLRITHKEKFFRIMVLHNYAKIKLPLLKSNSLIWKNILREANTDKFRINRLSLRLLLLSSRQYLRYRKYRRTQL